MQRSGTWLASLAVILLLATAGVVEAKGGASPDVGGKKEVPPGKAKDAPAPPPGDGTVPSPQPDPAPAPVPVYAPPPVETPATSPAPRPEPEAAVEVPSTPPADADAVLAAPADLEAPVDAIPEAALPAPVAEPAPAPEADLPPPADPLPTQDAVVALVPLAFQGPQESAAQGATSLPAVSRGAGLLWGIPLAGLVLLGVVLSSARLVQPKPLPRPAPAAAADQGPLVVAVRPRDVASLLRAAKAAVEAFRYEDAVRLFDQAIRLDPKLAVAHFCRGVCLRGLQREREAYAAFRRAYDLQPAEGAYRLELARACARLGRAGEAMDVLGALLHAMPQLVEDVTEDPSFAGLLDHPRFLAMTGRL